MDAAMKDVIDDLVCIKHEIIPPTSRIDATNSSAPNIDKGTCLRSGTLISMADGTKVVVEELNPGDIVVGKNGAPCQVLGRNDHLFATQNDEWMYIDTDLSHHMNPLNKKFSSTMKVHCLLVTGGIYVENRYVTHDSMPNLLAWPACMSTPRMFPTIDSLDDAEYIRELSYQISTEWKKIIEISASCMSLNDVEKAIKLSIEKFKYLICGDQDSFKKFLINLR
ncbi:24218_t:CDS:2 [Cetraspora pellucida]|uniref:24218_t:CDS:1 n=1 Tax=Cetraspora pellucida TaxID=1433469 RepID=A0A9N9NWG4_9GLOM|nr:24218_t:CDS:2 [Cetraspora pellucida]